jgi:glycosyl transferase family 87
VRRIDFIAYLVGLALGAAILIASGYADRSPGAVRQGDFAQFWVGPRAFILGMDPYAPGTWHATAVSLGALTTDTTVFGYFGWSLVLLYPFALLDLDGAAAVWLFVGLVAAASAMWTLLRAYLPGIPVAHTLVGLALLGSHPARLNVLLGQWGFFLLAALAGVIVLLRARRPVSAGASAVLFLVKPQLFLLSAPALAAWAWLNDQRRFVAAAIVFSVALALFSIALLPQWLGAWLREMPSQRLFDPPQTTTLATVLYGFFGPIGTWLALGTIIAAALVAFRFDIHGDAALAVWLALSSVAAPYTWSYDHILLLVPLVVGAGVVARRSRRAAVLLVVGGSLTFLIVATLLAVVAAARNLESYSAVVPVLMYVMIVWTLWPDRQDRPVARLDAGRRRIVAG